MYFRYSIDENIPSSFPKKAIFKLTEYEAYEKHKANKISKEEYESYNAAKNLKEAIHEALVGCIAFALYEGECNAHPSEYTWNVLEAKNKLMKLIKYFVAARNHIFSKQEIKTIPPLLNMLEQIYGLKWQSDVLWKKWCALDKKGLNPMEEEVSGRKSLIIYKNLDKLRDELYESLSDSLLNNVRNFVSNTIEFTAPEPIWYGGMSS